MKEKIINEFKEKYFEKLKKLNALPFFHEINWNMDSNFHYISDSIINIKNNNNKNNEVEVKIN
jgi:hypothetical protein